MRREVSVGEPTRQATLSCERLREMNESSIETKSKFDGERREKVPLNATRHFSCNSNRGTDYEKRTISEECKELCGLTKI